MNNMETILKFLNDNGIVDHCNVDTVYRDNGFGIGELNIIIINSFMYLDEPVEDFKTIKKTLEIEYTFGTYCLTSESRYYDETEQKCRHHLNTIGFQCRKPETIIDLLETNIKDYSKSEYKSLREVAWISLK